MGVAARLLTWRDLESWPEETGRRVELVHGELVMAPSPAPRHAWIASNLAYELGRFVREADLGALFATPVDVVLAPDVVYAPDLCFLAKERLALVGERIDGPPDLCIEIVSESNRTHDTVVKFADYARYGVGEYWIVDPREREISAWRNAGGRYELLGRARPGERLASVVLAGVDLDPAAVLTAPPLD